MRKAKVKVILAMLIFGTVGLFVKQIPLASSGIAFYRGLLGSLFLMIVLISKKDKISWNGLKQNAKILFFSGVAIGLNWILLFESYRYTTLSNATLSYYFAPLFVLLVSPVVLKEKLTAVKVGCILLALIGMYLIVGKSPVISGEYNHPLGILYGIGAAAFYASLILLNKFLKGLSGLESTMIQLAVASAILLPYVMLTEGSGLFHIPIHSLPYLLILGIVHTGIGYTFYFSAMQDLKGQTVAILSYIDPISAVFISALLLNENMSLIQLVGGIFILGAAFVSKWPLPERKTLQIKAKERR